MTGVVPAHEAVPRTSPGPVGRWWPSDLVTDVRARYLLGVAVLVGLYYGAAHLGYAFEFSGPVAAIVWLPVGVGIAFLYLGGLRYWPGVVIGDLLVNNYSTLPLGSALGQSCGNLIEVVLATWLLSRLCPSSPLSSISGLASMLAAIAAGTVASATIGPLSLWLGDVINGASLPHVWRTWWLGDFSGALIVLPLALAWSNRPTRAWLRGRVLEGALLLATVVTLSEVALHTTRPLSYVMFPALIWAALRFDQRGATLAIAIAAGFTIWGTTHYMGPFALQSINSSLLNTQLFMAVAALSALSVAALVSERERLAMSVQASRARLVEAADTERRRLERNLHDGAQQQLVALAAHLAMAAEEAQERPAKAVDLIETAQADLVLAIEELRELAHGIHPPVLREFGLVRAVEAATARATVPVELITQSRARLDDTAEATAYFIVLEAITNAHKYARASFIRVYVDVTPGRLGVVVSDNGVGGAIEHPGSGLQGLRDRVEATGGWFSLDSEPGLGTRIAAEIPATVIEGA
jgi:signal transduction histidine kinase